MTPLQEKVQELISSYQERHSVDLSGRELSGLLGKSRNHLSQIMNDGLVPSGEVLVRLGEVLEADDEQKRDLLLCAMRTKASTRARDAFWLEQALELTDGLMDRISSLEKYLRETGQHEEFHNWAVSGKRTRPKGKDDDSSGKDG